LNDSTLLFATRQKFLKDFPTIHPGERMISYNDIDVLQLHRKGSLLKGLGIGAAAGLVAGGIIGGLAYNPPTSESGSTEQFVIRLFDTRAESIVVGAVLGTLSGMVVGTIAGALSHKTFNIQGDKIQFHHMQKKAMIIP
jgi:hypothetical protein